MISNTFLEGDPMEWMGWNVLLEGRKLWTFLPPVPEVDASLGTYRVSPNAFGSHDISAGWQSDVDLYRRPRRGRRRTGSREGQVIPCWPSDCPAGQEVLQHATSGVQEEGDLVLIPPRHWHQVYHLEPSVAVASQYMDERVRDGVFRHMLRWCGSTEDDVLLSKGFDTLEPSEQVMRVLKEALVARYGQGGGSRAFADLTKDEEP